MRRISIYMFLTTFLMVSLLTFLTAADAQPIKIAYSDTKKSIAKTYMLKYILEQKVGIKVEITKMSLEEAWKNVSESKYDAMVCASLPEQKVLYDKYRLNVVDFGPNCRDKKNTCHTIVRKGLQEKRPALARFLYNFFLCERKLNSMLALVERDEIQEKVAHKWMKDHDDWITHIMGYFFLQGFTRGDWGEQI